MASPLSLSRSEPNHPASENRRKPCLSKTASATSKAKKHSKCHALLPQFQSSARRRRATNTWFPAWAKFSVSPHTYRPSSLSDKPRTPHASTGEQRALVPAKGPLPQDKRLSFTFPKVFPRHCPRSDTASSP